MDEEDRIEWMNANVNFQSNPSVLFLGRKEQKTFPLRVICNSMVLTKVGFFYMGSFLEKYSNFGPAAKKRMVMLNQYFLYKEEEESEDHTFLHCARTKVLGNSVFSLLRVVWVMES